MRMLLFVAVLACAAPLSATETEYLNMPLPAPYSTAPRTSEMSDEQLAAERFALRDHFQRRIDRPLGMQRLNAAIQLAEAEIASLDRQIAEYESISRPRNSNPFLYTLESARLARLEASLRLERLRSEKLSLDLNYHALRRFEQLR